MQASGSASQLEISQAGNEGLPVIDYREHPAYGGLFRNIGFWERIDALRAFAPYFIESLKSFATWQWRHFLNRKTPSALESEVAGPLLPKLGDLREDGAVAVRLESRHMARIRDLTAASFEELASSKDSLDRKSKFKDSVIKVNEPGRFHSLAEVFRETGLLEMVGAYIGHPVDVTAINAQINRPEDVSFWKGSFRAIGLEFPKTTYMHMDSTFGVVKFLVYMSEVGEEQGPFHFVLGSHRYETSAFEAIVRKANDRSGLESRSESKRRLFFALPKFLQAKCAFGYDVLDGSPESVRLLAREKRFLSSDGDLIVFDTNGVHRGAMVARGERRMLQVLLGFRK